MRGCPRGGLPGWQSQQARIEGFVAARNAQPDEPLEVYSSNRRKFEEMFERLLHLILDGSKTGTFSLGEPVR